MLRPVLLGALGCLLLVLTGCSSAPGALEPSRSPVSSVRPTAMATEQRVRDFGDRVSGGDGLVITVSAPRSVKPSPSAFPAAERAAVFEVTIDNLSSTTYRPSHLAISATVAGQLARQIADPAQGLGGMPEAGGEVPQGKSLHVTAAFEMPAEPTGLQLMVKPDSGVPDRFVTFAGQA